MKRNEKARLKGKQSSDLPRIKELSEYATEGDILAKRQILEELAYWLQLTDSLDDHPVSPNLTRAAVAWLVDGIRAGANGKSIDKTLGLKRGGGRNKWPPQWKELAVRVYSECLNAGGTNAAGIQAIRQVGLAHIRIVPAGLDPNSCLGEHVVRLADPELLDDDTLQRYLNRWLQDRSET